jgi:UDP-glucose 4-epimerase
MNILITGITGRIGSELARQLVDAGHIVRGLVWPRDRRVAPLQELGIALMEGSLTEVADVKAATADVDVIFHLGAAFQGGGPFTNEEYFEINVRGTFNMLEAARGLGARLQQFAYASSDALYEKYVPGGIPDPIREDAFALQPRGQYALTKLLGEELCLGYARTWELPVTVYRFAMTLAGEEILDYGQFYLSHWLRVFAGLENDEARAVYVELQAAAAVHGERCLVVARDGDGRSYKKHIAHAQDIVAGMMAGLAHAQARGEVFQLAGPAPFTWEEAVPKLADGLGMPMIEARLAGHAPTFYEFDLTKSRERIGFAPRYDIRRMIEEALALRQARAGR